MVNRSLIWKKYCSSKIIKSGVVTESHVLPFLHTHTSLLCTAPNFFFAFLDELELDGSNFLGILAKLAIW